MKLSQAPWRGGKDLDELLDALSPLNGMTRYVGGCVRDQLLDLPVSDIDLATKLAPRTVLDRLKQAGIKAVPTGIEHGTITAVVRGRPIEITTLRRDVSTDGRRATVAFTDDWREDAGRRDFTINALSADPLTLDVHDYFDGLADLERGCVRFIGDPLQRIAEDHLRILRFFRFHARFGRGEPDAAALEACTARANDLMALSRERIADELLKLLGVAGPFFTLALMEKRGIFRPVLPEITQAGLACLMRLLDRERRFGLAPDPERRLAALLPPEPEAAAAVAARLRLSKRATKRLTLAANRLIDDVPKVLAYRIGHEGALDRLLLADAETGLEDALLAIEDWTRPNLELSGGDLIAMGVPPGPEVSRILRAVEAEWAAAGFPPGRDAAVLLAKPHLDRLLRSG